MGSGADYHFIDELLKNPFYIAIKDNDIDQVQKLIEKGQDVNERFDLHYDALGVAIYYNNFEIVKILLEHGYDVTKLKENYDRISYMDEDIIKLLNLYGLRLDFDKLVDYMFSTNARTLGNIQRLNYFIRNAKNFYVKPEHIEQAVRSGNRNLEEYLDKEIKFKYYKKMTGRFEKSKPEQDPYEYDEEKEMFPYLSLSGQLPHLPYDITELIAKYASGYSQFGIKGISRKIRLMDKIIKYLLN
jgi:hypothetical protein